MSSESASYYLVEMNARLDEAARQAAITAALQCERDFLQLCADLERAGHEYRDVGVAADRPAVPDASKFDLENRSGAEAYLEQWRTSRAKADMAQRRAVSQGISRRLLASLVTNATSISSKDVLGEHARTRTSSLLEALTKQLQDILGETVGEPADMEALRLDAQRLIEAARNGAEVAAALTGFRERARGLTDSTQCRIHDKDEAAGFLIKLAGLRGPKVEAVQDQLKRVASGEEALSPTLRERVAMTIEDAKAAADADWVGELIRSKLEALGYEVGPDFETAQSLPYGTLSVSKRDWRNRDGAPLHEVQIDLEPSNGNLLRFEVLHERQEALSELRRNAVVEEEWCADHISLLRHLRERAVDVKVVANSIKPPGTREPSKITAPSVRRSRRPGVKQKTHNPGS